MEINYIYTIILILVIVISQLLHARTKKALTVQIVILIIATLALLGIFIYDATRGAWDFAAMIFILLGIIGIFRKLNALRNGMYR